MPSISYHQAKNPNAYTLELRPPITDRAAELLCRHTVDPMLMVVNNSGLDHTRLRAESSTNYDIGATARQLGPDAYPGQSVEIINLP